MFYIIPIVIIIFTIIIISIIKSRNEKKMLHNLFILEKNKSYGPAIEILKKLIKRHPKMAVYYLRLANVYLKNKEIKSAVNTYLKMLNEKLFSTQISKKTILEKLIPLLIQTKNIEEAFLKTKELLSIDSNNTIGLITLARIYASQEKLSEAAGYIKQAIKNSPNNSDAHLYYGLILLDAGDLRAATIELEKAIKADKSNVKALYFLALAYKQLGYKEKSEKIFSILKINSLDKIHQNIVGAGILKQNYKKIDLDNLSINRHNTKNHINRIKDFNEFLNSSGEKFYQTCVYIIKRLGIIIEKQINNPALDPTKELNFFGTYKQKKTFIYFYKTSSPIGNIQITDFISNVETSKAEIGILITTSKISESGQKILENKKNIIVFDRNKITRFFN